jgi:hypothetical protein
VAVDLAAVDRRLRQILDPYRDRLAVAQDGPGGLSLHLPGLADQPHGYVAGVRPGKRYVSYYLMPVYGFPELVLTMSPDLRRRMQGKSCFNFSAIDEGMLAELAVLTARGIEHYREAVAAGSGPFADEARFGAARA